MAAGAGIILGVDPGLQITGYAVLAPGPRVREAGIIRSRHPALFFALLNAALNQPPAFPMLLNRIAPEIDPETSRDLLIETTIATFLHLPS